MKILAYISAVLVMLMLAWGGWLIWNQQASPVATTVEVRLDQHIEPPDLPFDQTSVARQGEATVTKKDLGASLLMAIRDLSNAPLSGVTVVLRSNSEDEKIHSRITRENGIATFDNITAGVYSYTVSAPPRPTLNSTQALRLAFGEYRSVELQLEDYHRTISGIVLDQAGAPISGLAIVAREFGTPVNVNTSTPQLQSLRETSSGENGGFEISGLSKGEIQLRSRADEHYPAVQTIVGRNADSVVLRLARSRRLHVSGQVTNSDGEPLEGIRVLSLNQPGGTVYSDSGGRYELFLFVDPGRTRYPFRFLADNYKETRKSLRYEDIAARLEVSLDARLNPIGSTLAVYGMLRDSYGSLITGEQLRLHSPSENTSYSSTSGQDGAFVFPAIVRAVDYSLKIKPHGNYQDYSLQDLDLSYEVPPLELALQPLATGRLRGTMVDSNGNPVPNAHVWIRSSSAQSRTLQVKGDASGNFVVDQVPEGSVSLSTRTVPLLRMDGITIEADTEQTVQIVFDLGDSALTGRVIDSGGQAVAGARVSLHGINHQPSVHARSTRSTTTDTSGRFNFTRLGAWSRRLDVSAAGFANWQQIIGSEQGQIEVRLASLEN